MINNARRPGARCALRLVATASLCALLAGASAAGAEEVEDPNAATKAITARIQAETAKTNAGTERLKAQLAALGLPVADGKTTLGEGAGAMEASMLSAAAMNTAAAQIAKDMPKGRSIIVLGGSEALDFGLSSSLTLEMQGLAEAAEGVARLCEAVPEPRARTLGPSLSVLGAVISALKVDTEVRGVSVTLSDRAFASAVAAAIGANAYLPSEAVLPPDFKDAVAGVGAGWKRLREARGSLLRCRSKLASSDPKAATALDAAIAEIDTFTKTASQATATGPAPLVRASLLEGLADKNPAVLRAASEYVGGSLLKRTSLWTALGASGVSLTGGLVASYRLAEPKTGQVLKAGVLICPSDHTNMRAVHRGGIRPRECAPSLGGTKASIR